MVLFLPIAIVSIIGFGTSAAYVKQSSHHSESSYSSGSSHSSGHAYSYKSQSAQGPGYSYSYSYSDGGSPFFLPGYAAGYHTFTPLIIPPIDFDIDFDLDDDIEFDIDTDLDLDIDLDFPGIEYGLGYIGKYGHWYRKPRYGFSKLYSSINGDIWNYGGRYGYDHLGELNFGSLDFFK